jgi:hypothetical protein
MQDQGNNDGGVGRLFRDLKPRSKHSVATAIEATRHEGLSGTLIIQIHAQANKPAEVFFTNADLRLVPAIGLQ